MTMKGCSVFPKPQHYWNLTIRLFSVKPGHSLGGGLTPLQRCSQRILQPHLFEIEYYFLYIFTLPKEIIFVLSVGLIIHWHYSLQRAKANSNKRFPGYDTKRHLIRRQQFWRSKRVWGTSLLPFFPCPNLTRSGHTHLLVKEMFKNYSYSIETWTKCN